MSTFITKTAANFATLLASGISVGSTSFSLLSALTKAGSNLPAGKYGFTINQGKSNEQHLIGDVSGTNVTNVQGVDHLGNISTGALKVASINDIIKITDYPNIQFMGEILNGTRTLDGSSPLNYDSNPTFTAGSKQLITVKYGDDTFFKLSNLDTDPTLGGASASDTKVASQKAAYTFVEALRAAVVLLTTNQTIAGIKTFSSSPKVPTPTAIDDAVRKDYVDAAIVAGGVDASTTVKGIVKLSAAPTSPVDPIAVGVNDVRLPDADPDTLYKPISGFGDGVDGDVVISTPTTLTRDMFYNNLTVNSTLTTDGYRIFVKETLSGNGTIKWGTPNNGGNGITVTSGTSSGGGSGGAQGGSGELKNIAGQVGGNTAACSSGTAGASGGAANPCIGSNGANGGRGGGGGTYTYGGGGAGGTATAPSRKFGLYKEYTIQYIDRVGTTFSVLLAQASSAGGGGGGFACNSAGSGKNGSGGGGGASGGIVMIVAKNITGTFTIEANGGNGGNGGNAADANGGAGGGGGGGNGGHIVLIYSSYTHTGAKTVNGGNGGNAGATGGGVAGVAGNNGTAGNIYLLDINKLI